MPRWELPALQHEANTIMERSPKPFVGAQHIKAPLLSAYTLILIHTQCGIKYVRDLQLQVCDFVGVTET